MSVMGNIGEKNNYYWQCTNFDQTNIKRQKFKNHWPPLRFNYDVQHLIQ